MLLLQGCGNYGENRPLRGADLESAAWREPARKLYDQLLRDSKAELPNGFDELTISPDGSLWLATKRRHSIKDENLAKRYWEE